MGWINLGIRIALPVQEPEAATVPGEDAVTLTVVCVQRGASIEDVVAYRRVGDVLVVQLNDERIIRAKV